MLSDESDDEIAELYDAMVPENSEDSRNSIALLPLTVAEVAEQSVVYPAAPVDHHLRRRRPVSSSLPAAASTSSQLQRLPQSRSCDDSAFCVFSDDSNSCKDGTAQGRQTARKQTNKEAARQCRQRKKTREEELKRERLSLMSQHTELQYEVQKLKRELTLLVDAITCHNCVMAVNV